MSCTAPAGGGSAVADQLVTFEIRLTVVDKPTTRRRWNGDPMASAEASTALWDSVEELKAFMKDRGFEVVRTAFGATVREVEVQR